jgi:hypothetical protein
MPKQRIKLRCFSPGWDSELNAEGNSMRKITLFVAAVTVFVLIGVATWIHIGTPAPTSAVAGPADNAPTMMIGAKGLLTSPYDDYDIVAH